MRLDGLIFFFISPPPKFFYGLIEENMMLDDMGTRKLLADILYDRPVRTD